MALVGCAHFVPAPSSVAISGTLLTLEAETSDDAETLTDLTTLATEALPRLRRWGGLRVPTRLVIVADHAALEARVHRPGFGWLRAWARYDVVYLQSPRSWNPFGLRPGRAELRDLLTHELAHCAMYQAAASADDWSEKEIPVWFREGFASWTAQQSGKRLSPHALATELRAHPDVNPFTQADALLPGAEPLVYAAAHFGFALLVQAGDERVRALLAKMHEGFRFPAAFALAMGESETAFEGEALAALRNEAP